MKSFRTSGPFPERPFFRDEEIERMAVEELLAVDLLPSSPSPIRIERFVEKRFRLTGVRYEHLPRGVLGYTLFGPRGVEAIVVSRDLGEERSQVADRRVNSTLAHEAAHGLLHAFLFIPESTTGSLFDGSPDVSSTRILCRDDPRDTSRTHRYDGRWWEYQANRMMGALLIPKPLAHKCLKGSLMPTGSFGIDALPREARDSASRQLVDTFNVNPVLARIRLETLFPTRRSDQLTL